MIFDLNLFKKFLKDEGLVGGFDKVLQADIIMSGNRIAFAPEAVVYDEKVSTSKQIITQRSRWLNSWFKYFTKGFVILGMGVIKLDINKTLFGIMSLRPPIIIFMGFSIFFLLDDFFLFPFITIYWGILIVLFILCFIFSMWKEKASPEIWKSLIKLPVFVFYLFLSLIRIRKANKNMMETEHTKLLYIEDVIGNNKLN
jgi:cellulose synthase/poly-beta-1,6-N-acetylglucosamine synthase-like glycosyltransferase